MREKLGSLLSKRLAMPICIACPIRTQTKSDDGRDRSDDHLLHRKAMSEAAFGGAKDDYGGARGDYGRRTGVSNIRGMYATFDGAKGDYGRMI